MKKVLSFIVMLFPWKIRRFLLIKFWKYKIHKSAHIGLSYIYPKNLIMEEGAAIGHFNIAINLDTIYLGKNTNIARSNWITGFPTKTNSHFFSHQKNRKSELYLDDESAITKHHHIDCTNIIHIGKFTTIAGYYSQFLTHSIDIYEGRQNSAPINIGDYCFISTGVKILGGSELPSHSILAAGAILNKPLEKEWTLYGGVPAKKIKDIPKSAKYFSREKGYVY